MDEKFTQMQVGDQVVLEAAYEVLNINPKSQVATLRNLRNGEVEKHSLAWLHSVQQNGFTVHIIPKE